jgi:hypothetical protein
MKIISFFTGLLLISSATFSQVESAQIGAEFKEVAKSTGLNGIESYSTGEVKGSQFFYPTWTSGTVTTVHNEVIGKDYSFLYDIVRQQLFIKWKDSSAILLAEKDQTKGFTLNTDKVHTFISASLYNPSDKDDFYEVLSGSTQGYSLLKLTKAKFVKADQTDIMKMKDGENYDEFVNEVTYYISYNGGIPQPITFKAKSIEKAFPALKQKVEAYYNQNDNAATGDNFLIGLLQMLNN